MKNHGWDDDRLPQADREQLSAAIPLEVIPTRLSVCKVPDYSSIDLAQPFCFTGATDQEMSLVCPTEAVPDNTFIREDGWRAFRICGELDFSLIGILARITGILASRQISVFAISTFNTDYVLMKAVDFDRGMAALRDAGYIIMSNDQRPVADDGSTERGEK